MVRLSERLRLVRGAGRRVFALLCHGPVPRKRGCEGLASLPALIINVAVVIKAYQHEEGRHHWTCCLKGMKAILDGRHV